MALAGRDRELPADDIGVIWFGHGVELARRLEAFIAEIRGLDLTADEIAGQLAEILTADHDPRPPARPQLGLPPLRPATPRPELVADRLGYPPEYGDEAWARRAGSSPPLTEPGS